jgi:hypothetical protein
MSIKEKEAIAKHLRCLYGTRAGKKDQLDE